MAIEATHYEETRKALMVDPIIVAMAAEIPDDVDLTQSALMNAALREYNARGGTVATHIGGPIEAIRRLKGQIAP